MTAHRSAISAALLLPLALCAQHDTTSVRVMRNGTTTPVALERLKDLPSHDARIIDHEGAEASYTGAWLMDLLKLNADVAGIAKREQVNTYVRAKAADGYTALIALPECDSSFRERPALLAWMKNGRPLDPHDGPFQLIMPDDRKHARDVRQVQVLEVVTP